MNEELDKEIRENFDYSMISEEITKTIDFAMIWAIENLEDMKREHKKITSVNEKITKIVIREIIQSIENATVEVDEKGIATVYPWGCDNGIKVSEAVE